MNVTTPAGQRILAVDLICIYYVSEWKMKAVQICLSGLCGAYRRQHEHHQWQRAEDVAHTLNGVGLMELCGVLLCPGKMACILTVHCMCVSACHQLSHRDKIHFHPAIIPPTAPFRGHLAKLSQNLRGKFLAAQNEVSIVAFLAVLGTESGFL